MRAPSASGARRDADASRACPGAVRSSMASRSEHAGVRISSSTSGGSLVDGRGDDEPHRIVVASARARVAITSMVGDGAGATAPAPADQQPRQGNPGNGRQHASTREISANIHLRCTGQA